MEKLYTFSRFKKEQKIHILCNLIHTSLVLEDTGTLDLGQVTIKRVC